MCLSLLHCHPCFVSEPDCNCCLSNKYIYMQLRSHEVTRVNFHLSDREPHKHQSSQVSHTYSFIHHTHTHTQTHHIYTHRVIHMSTCQVLLPTPTHTLTILEPTQSANQTHSVLHISQDATHTHTHTRE